MYRILLIFLNIFLAYSDEVIEFNEKIWEKCGKELRGDSGKDVNLVCFRSSKHLLIQKVEILSLRPFILQYHNMVHRRLAKRSVLEAEALQLEQLRISGKTETPEKSQVRAANGTWLIHTKRPNFARMFWNLQVNIRALDLSTAEPWQILSYNSEGYYAPHYDFLNPETNKVLVESRGNRIATVLVILQIAKKGGTTVFPKININIRPKIGDVVVWLNTVPDGESDSQTLHAACPIKEGTKIGATLWVHANGQEFSLPYTSNGKDSFEGEEYWDEQYLDLCDNVAKDTTWQWRRAVCFEYLISFQAVKVEVISWSPGLVIYRDMFTKKQVLDYIEIMKHQDFEEQQVVNDDGTEYYSKYRKANGTQIIAPDFPAALSIWKTVKILIPTLNIESSEDIVASPTSVVVTMPPTMTSWSTLLKKNGMAG
ncbi:hypothetical protein L5515_009938 [Caenorhabditis briggsae]|uniref:Fe2OG dioxygenase domain-containing protein n=1 Tax=Caenorhabditis briggsae TaxID=6238 RepID=A0AAE9JQP0_CAEBR|nr:hypothetical protein L5515_009938 [Caenorhabditis briggsae]